MSLNFRGIKLNASPFSGEPGKFASAFNLRATVDGSLQPRPGYALLGAGTGLKITDLQSYSALGTDNLPLLLGRNVNDEIVLSSTSAVVASLAGGPGYGAAMIPFRPASSPQSWMYVAGRGDYQKLSAPIAGVVTAQKVGIAEPQAQTEAGPQTLRWTSFDALAVAWTNGGTMGALSDTQLVSDAITTAIFVDPVIAGRYS